MWVPYAIISVIIAGNCNILVQNYLMLARCFLFLLLALFPIYNIIFMFAMYKQKLCLWRQNMRICYENSVLNAVLDRFSQSQNLNFCTSTLALFSPCVVCNLTVEVFVCYMLYYYTSFWVYLGVGMKDGTFQSSLTVLLHTFIFVQITVSRFLESIVALSCWWLLDDDAVTSITDKKSCNHSFAWHQFWKKMVVQRLFIFTLHCIHWLMACCTNILLKGDLTLNLVYFFNLGSWLVLPTN